MRIEQVEQGFSKFGIRVVQSLRHARAEQGRALYQAFDMRIVAGIATHLQPGGNLGIALRIFPAQRPENDEFALVLCQQFVHGISACAL